MDSGYADLRVSNAEREQVVERLQEAYADGRLDHDEFDMRTHLAMTSKTRRDLDAVLLDLQPVPKAGRVPAPNAGPSTSEERMLAAVAHGLGYFTLFVGPLIMMMTAGKRSAYVREHAAEAVNFQLTVLLVTIVTFGIGGLLYAVTWIVAAVAALFALTGQPFRTPFILRLVK
ncbi:DUF1707 and DUF4870 domain-containing protein [Actinomadura logoneensis]|uniref:DUF1707 and DUF4870 domain-containing protein n=1 Tax=Actinomadura logoneensis TaxID=2293572 RepID=A0A372JEB7_9ACTN|nr:DUF1707 and DUF4870 domain-containing protein [Actinomadura logoneensis]RFU38351.1 DUF1707 and DUF4870 domain-containing protein [Actinomadura logoneensis]